MASSDAEVKNIDDITDIAEMFLAMTALNISCQGLTDLEQMKKKAKDELAKLANSPSLCAGEVSSMSTEHMFSDQYQILLN